MLKVTIKTYALEFCSKYLPDILPPSAINLDFNNDKWEIGSEAIPVMDRTGTIMAINDELELSMENLNPGQIIVRNTDIKVFLYYDEEETYALYYYYRPLKSSYIHNIWHTSEMIDISRIKIVCERVNLEDRYVDFFAGIKYRDKRPDMEDYDSGTPWQGHYGPFKINNSPFDKMIIKKTPGKILSSTL
ncbi:hypothetical protein [Desulfonatronospira sp.]|uniref:hypothetical protein n=1 Tax=Desulfonatronospira sp. TaxID=1962951 RepID=UPI0025C460CA|nr:hypothetical protein [Desulfonatronospira sp.]